MGSRERKIILIIALIVAAAVIAAVCIYTSPASPAEENASVSPAASASAAQAGTGGSVIISELMEKLSKKRFKGYKVDYIDIQIVGHPSKRHLQKG